MTTRPKAILFTRTNWSEPPRLRHQIAGLLKQMGYEVYFFEKPSFKSWISIHKLEGITFIRHFELVHHRLRFFKILTRLNSIISKLFIRKSIDILQLKNAVVLNFNYDYYYLNDIFAKGFITIINDDFVNKLKNKNLKNNTILQLGDTCSNSIITLTVSYPLRDQILKFTNRVELFFPWAEKQYEAPSEIKKRDVALFYGYINYRLDWPLIIELLKKDIKLRFIGPIEKSVNEQYLQELKSNKNVELLTSQNITEVDFSDVCCSILPWDTSFEGIKAITVNNKCFNLLSYGIPLIYSDLPHLIEANEKVISKCITANDFAQSIRYFIENFGQSQLPIQSFLSEHYANKRRTQLEEYLNI